MAELALRLTGGDRWIESVRAQKRKCREHSCTSVSGGGEENGGCSPSRETEAARSREQWKRWLLANNGKTPVSTVRVVSGEDGDTHHVLDKLLLGKKGYG
uniref:Uncharacterized protein n=1 Tax=Oryza punctata TaxID=4537 RepID=A0A0E0LTU9_ORYPU